MEIEKFEQQFLELVGEFQSITSTEIRLRENLRAEANRAESAEAARDAAERAAAEARNAAGAATAAATHAASALAKANDDCTGLKIQLDLAERQRTTLEEKCCEITSQVEVLERELQLLRPVHSAQGSLQRQYLELQERIRVATSDAQREQSRLESELRRAERCAGAGAELRERARLAAAALTREKRLAAEELHHTNRELLKANAEIAKLSGLVTELQQRFINDNKNGSRNQVDIHDVETLAEVRAALQAEREGSARVERALAAALADNATLSAQLHAADNVTSTYPKTLSLGSEQKDAPAPGNNNCPIDSFLAE